MNIQKKLFTAAHMIISGKVDAVRKTALKAGGVISWDFSQVRNPVRSIIVTDPVTAIGVCEMVSAKWLEMHAKGDHIANWLGSGTTISTPAVMELMKWFKEGIASGNQSGATASWLEANGIRPKKAAIQHHGGRYNTQTAKLVHSERDRGSTKRRVQAEWIAYELALAHRAKGTHKMLGIFGAHFAHACACWSDGDVVYMDPNFGEFWFETPMKFYNWFPKYWHAAGYGTPAIGLSEKYEVDHYFKPLTTRIKAPLKKKTA